MLNEINTVSASIQWSPALLLFIIWSLAWMGVALWKAARNNSKGWFIALLLINSLGILEILYIFVFSKRGKNKQEAASESVMDEAESADVAEANESADETDKA